MDPIAKKGGMQYCKAIQVLKKSKRGVRGLEAFALCIPPPCY